MSDEDEAPMEPTEEVIAEQIDEIEEPKELTLEEQLTEALVAAETAEKEISYRDADIANMRKRHTQERLDLIRYGSQNLSRRLIDLLDDFDRAVTAMPDNTDDSIMEGITMMRNNLEKAILADGAKKIEVTEGQKFDPKNMEAITTIPPSEEHPLGVVVQLLENGWMMHDRVLRPARVVVTAVE
jgi:molecular chaperone GrpE (heat shock protein)